MNSKAALAVLGILAAAIAGPVAAQDEGWYLGGSLGFAQYKDTCKRVIVPCDSTDGAWRAFGGYQFSRYYAAELGYGNLGEASGSGFRRETKAFDLSLLGTFPIVGRLSGFGRLGIYRARTAVDDKTVVPAVNPGVTGSGFTFGAGLSTELWKLGLRTEWQRYQNVGGASTGEDDVDAFFLSLLWRF